MIVVYGKGKVWQWLSQLLTKLDIDFVWMDDADRDNGVLKKSQYIIMSPGISPKHDVYKHYKKKILSELSYLGLLLPKMTLPPITFIGITGTNGKSTTSWVMYQSLQKLFPDRGIWLTGNFEIPLSQTLVSILEDGLDKKHICVVECSSFMLYKLKHFIFDYSIFLNIARDHMDWHETMDDYFGAKMRICAQTRKSFVSHTINVLLPTSLEKKAVIIPESIDISYTKFIGNHNIQNMAAVNICLEALCQELATSFDPHYIFTGLEPLPHRLQLIRQIDSIAIIDDGVSTSAQSLLAALDAMQDTCVAIVWWYNKWDDYSILSIMLRQKVAFLICIGDTKYIFADIAKSVGVSYALSDTLEHAVSTAIDQARHLSVDTVLFSPGAASFDMFTNVYDRVEQFNHIVNTL